ncbi:MarR family winged helix-turn-helix transcriptional regulator [Qipengyuania gaetbuli]|uniref:MarR family winged helix-turn-helix transcriptional regulator n=1 Tax=Qipengyuania gaetbuli TaxID=266952 RepID=UPI001CD4157A|nr:MarR family transcriptional regulator [Qipengyuania gaetbuli]MCA0911180.1 MarR family transcriptional regulator [Qipengyuania gaetbuli]
METNIGYLLSDSGRVLRRTFDERVRSLGLTAVQARLLLSLVKFPDNNQAFYADRIEVEPITLTRIVDRMEEAGWVERVADPADRRARLLHLTDKSREIVERLRAIVDGLVADMAEGLSKQEQATLANLLDRVSANLSADRTLKDVANG